MSMDEGGIPVQHSKFHFDNMHWKDPTRYGPLLLYQVGDLGCEGGYTTGAHEQFCYEISYIVSGKGTFSTDGAARAVKSGDVYVNRPGEVHDVVADRVDPVRYFYVAFNPAEGDCGADLEAILGKFDAAAQPVVTDRYDLASPFVAIFNELINGKEHAGAMIESCLMQLVILACRDFGDSAASGYSPPAMERAKRIVYEAVNYIDANLGRITDLSEICAKFDYSASYLSHLFTREMGRSMQEYYDAKRFETAKRWLAGTPMSVTEIAEKLKYQSIHSFSRAFRQNYGVSPTEYRNAHKE